MNSLHSGYLLLALQITCKECLPPSAEKGYAPGEQFRLFCGKINRGLQLIDSGIQMVGVTFGMGGGLFPPLG